MSKSIMIFISSVRFIELPAGIIQGIFFNPGIPNYVNYARLGMIAGHELTHAFDDQGRMFGGDGNMIDWWSPEIGSKYLEKTRCVIDQYNGYTVKELNNTHVSNVAAFV